MKRVTPLHLAVELQNNFSINIILKYMSIQDQLSLATFKDVWCKLLSYQSFSDFIEQATFQTWQMTGKQTLKIDESQRWSEDIVTINEANSCFLDNLYFKDVIQEKQGNTEKYTIFPIKMVCLEIHWIIQDQNEETDEKNWGLEFLKQLAFTENLDLFTQTPIQIVIDYLYFQFKATTLKYRFPFYLFNLAVFLFTVFVFEQIASNIQQQEARAQRGKKSALDVVSDRVTNYQFVGAINLLSSFTILYTLCQQYRVLREEFLKTQWAWYDVGYLILNTIVSLMILGNAERYWIRILLCGLSLIVWQKFLYYLILSDKISPLINTIYHVMYDIVWFMLILVINILMFATAFYLIGKNQVQFDGLKVEEDPPYRDPFSAVKFTYLMLLGEVGDANDFGNGEETRASRSVHAVLLWLIFIVASFSMIVHLLNMLIAIMANTFEANQAITEQNIMKNKIKFVLDNWWMSNVLRDQKY